MLIKLGEFLVNIKKGIPFILINSIVFNSIIPFSGYLIIIGLLLFLAFKNQIYIIVNRLYGNKYILILSIYIIFCTFRSEYKLDSLLGIIIIFVSIFNYLITREYLNNKDCIIKFLISFKISIIIISVIGIVQYYFGENIYFWHCDYRLYLTLYEGELIQDEGESGVIFKPTQLVKVWETSRHDE